jgi:hypothetical protein
MEEYKAVARPLRGAEPLDIRMLEKAKAFEKAHGRLVLVMESAAVALGAAGLLGMLGGL